MTNPSPFTATTADGAVLQASREGSGPALMLLSGLGGTAGFWAQSAAALAASCEVIRFDQRGIGSSTRGTAACNIAQLARDVLAVLDGARLERCTLLGHSTGGCIGQSVAAQAPDRLSGLILSATWLRPSRYMTGLFRTRRAMLEQDPEGYAAMGAILAFAPEWLEANWTHYEAAVARAPATAAEREVVRERIDALMAFDGSASVSAVATLPTLVVGAADDMIVPAFLQRDLAAALPGSELVLLEGGGHFFPISRSADFTACVARWLADGQR
ncbi:MAG TPA: alpha/beta fold hydrolase [Hyphomicrobiaceae bacterium]|nr:alpha/beta fold hydrolase [Hyphomicrobiaceae bacterium]